MATTAARSADALLLDIGAIIDRLLPESTRQWLLEQLQRVGEVLGMGRALLDFVLTLLRSR